MSTAKQEICHECEEIYAMLDSFGKKDSTPQIYLTTDGVLVRFHRRSNVAIDENIVHHAISYDEHGPFEPGELPPLSEIFKRSRYKVGLACLFYGITFFAPSTR